mmetsp:Transcript_11/g.30  ORF Transcript_11/g.30 Transcript_11/m.30 type:complete len:529 (-) Transcript_11:106-1692(-)
MVQRDVRPQPRGFSSCGSHPPDGPDTSLHAMAKVALSSPPPLPGGPAQHPISHRPLLDDLDLRAEVLDRRQDKAEGENPKLGADSMEIADTQLRQAAEAARKLEELECSMRSANLKLSYEMVASQEECRRARDLAGRLEKTERNLQSVHAELESDISASKEERRAAEALAEALRTLVQEMRFAQAEARTGGGFAAPMSSKSALSQQRQLLARDVWGSSAALSSGMTTPDLQTATPEIQPRSCAESPLVSMHGPASPAPMSPMYRAARETLPAAMMSKPQLLPQGEMLLSGISTAPDLSRPDLAMRQRSLGSSNGGERDMSSVRRSFEVSQARLRQLSANMDRLAELEAISQKHGSAQAKSQQDLNSLQTECAQMQSNIAAMQKDIEGLNKKFTQVKAFAASEKSPQSRGRHTDAWNARWAAENVRWSTEIVRVTKEWDSRFLQGSQDLGQMVADSEARLRNEFNGNVKDLRLLLDSSCRCLREDFARMSLQQEARHLDHARALQETAEGFDVLLQRLRQEIGEATRRV